MSKVLDEMFKQDEVTEQPGADDNDEYVLDTAADDTVDDDNSDTGDDIQEEAPRQEKKPEHVPLAKYLDDKNEWKRKLQDMESRIEKYQTIEDRLNQYYADQKKEEQPEVTYDEDPAAYLKNKLDQREREIQELREWRDQQTKQHESRSSYEQAIKSIQAQEAEFHRETPDYEEALNHVRRVEMMKMQVFGQAQGWSEADMRNMLAQGEINAALQAMQMGINPAKYAYEVAKSYGYVPKESPTVKAETEFARKAKGAKTDKGISKGAQEETREPIGRSIFEQAVAEVFPKFKGR